MHLVILGDGPLGRAVALAAVDDGHRVDVLGRPRDGRHALDRLRGADVVVDATRGAAVATDVDTALRAGVRRMVIATTGWAADRDRVASALRTARASAVAAPNFSLGVALFMRLVDVAASLYGAVDAFDPYLVEWHRRTKADRPSGTALDLADRIARHHPRLTTASDLETVSIRAGASPGMHLVGFDSASESVEIRLTARDRAAYATGVLAAADWLLACERPPGLHAFDHVVDELLARPAAAA
jgi:4-hydroxy-tetrahydrodipicolinate reductase